MILSPRLELRTWRVWSLSRSFSFIHGDLHIEHVFVDGDRVTGIIDWSEARQGDALYDLATLTLAHEDRLDDVIAGYGGDVDRDVVRAWWSWRCLVVIRWLFENGYGSPEQFPRGCGAAIGDAPVASPEMEGPGNVVRRFFELMEARDWEGAGRLLSPAAVIEFSATGERFVGPAFLAMNAAYPEGWSIQVVETLAHGVRVAAQVRVVHGADVFWCAGFYSVTDGVITGGVEHWVTEGADPPPDWREPYTSA